MRRVLAVIGFSSLFACIICLKLPKQVSAFTTIICLVLFIIVVSVKQLRKTIILSVLLLSVLLASINCYFKINNIDKINSQYNDKEINLSATLTDYPEKSENTLNYIFKSDDGFKFKLASESDLDIRPGDTLNSTFKLNNKYKDYAEDIYFSAYLSEEETVTIKHNNSNNYFFENLRQKFKGYITEYTAEGAGITKAIVFSDKTNITNQQYINLRKCGLLHATATSGMHLSLVVGILFFILSGLGFSKRKSSIISIVIIVLFMLVIGFMFSFARAGIMLLLIMCANMFYKESDAINSLGLAVILLLVINPYTALSCSFLLSLCATLGIVLLYPVIFKWFQKTKINDKIITTIVSAGISTLVATIFTFPVTYYFFGYFSIAGLLANIVLFPYISLVLILGLSTALTGFLPLIPEMLGYINSIFVSVINNVCEFISKFKYCLISVDYQFVGIWIIVLSILISICILVFNFTKLNKARVIRITTYLATISLLFGVLASIIQSEDKCNIRVLSAGNAMSTVITDKNNTIVIGLGGSADYSLENYFTQKCINNVDLFVFPTNKTNYYKCAKQLAYLYKPKNVLMDMSDDSSYAIRTVSNGTKFYDINNISCFKIGKININIFNQKDSNALLIKVNGKKILIVDKYVNINQLTDECKNVNILIVNTTAPEYIENVVADSLIVCSKSIENAQNISSNCDTYSNADYSIDVEVADKIKLRRAK